MTLEFRIPISPTPGFFAQIRLFALSLARLGEPYGSARIVVSVGDCADAETLARANPWSDAFPIVWHAVDHVVCKSMPFAASGLGRYLTPSEADVVIMSDADTCPILPFTASLARLNEPTARVAGLQAHYTPFAPAESESQWRALLDREGLGHVALTRTFSLDFAHAAGLGPPYFNYGFVAMNAAAFASLRRVMPRFVGLVHGSLVGNRFFAQIALTLAILTQSVDVIELDHTSNCANDDGLMKSGLVDVRDVRLIHYMRGSEMQRETFLFPTGELQAFLATPKENPITERLRAHVASIPALLHEFRV